MLASSPPHHSAEKFSPATIASGLRSLLVPPSGAGVVLTRALAAASSSRGCGAGTGVQERRDGDNIHHREHDATAEEEEEDDDDEGCWVSYGRRKPRRRLPPPIPSRGALRRTRTQAGRLIIRIAPVVWRECIRAWRRGGRLTMQLVDHEDALTFPAPNRTLLEPDDDTASSPTTGEEGVSDGTAAASIGSEGIVNNDEGEEAPVPAQEVVRPLPVVPPPRVPSAGCFEDVVFNYGSIGGTSLHRVPSLRMVH